MRLILGLSRTAWALLLLLLAATAGVTHAATLLAMPWRSHHDAFARIAALGPIGAKVLLPEDGTDSGPVGFRDPAFVTVVCRFDLRVQPFRLSLLPFDNSFVTLGFHSRHGLGFYGLTVRAADATQFDLDLALANHDAARSPKLDAGEHVITVEVPEPEGFVVLATPGGEGLDHAEARERLSAFQCRTDAARP